ncbi:hypothetical protein [Streptomyces sp. JH34]|uniref:hypothetical protein n=1 Tax=Streptomyces sp. JH34 TaxID=2793633 RepID=UPI0023F71B12|nr:hypothetical protein [Streptomyces sp. JH34]MDF6019646.1 hypothetical protein [Streptomyces sp. JH34]
MVTGQVTMFQERYERRATSNDPVTVWSFRLERQDERGQPLPRVGVEMRGTGFDGTLAQGDWVRIDEAWQPGTTLQTRQIANLSTNSTVRARGEGSATKAGRTVALVLFVLFFLAVATFIVVGWVTSM